VNVFGPPPDREEALNVLRVAVELGVTYIDIGTLRTLG
jgi:aryl-alcohol dehydrogenase-like predicted oxidoreductase